MRPDAVAHESLTNARALYNLLWRMVLRNSEDVLNGPSWVGFMSSVGSGEAAGVVVARTDVSQFICHWTMRNHMWPWRGLPFPQIPCALIWKCN